MTKGLLISTVLFILGIFIGLIQLWFSPWSAELFIKLIITVGALLIISLIVSFILKEVANHKKIQSGDDLH